MHELCVQPSSLAVSISPLLSSFHYATCTSVINLVSEIDSAKLRSSNWCHIQEYIAAINQEETKTTISTKPQPKEEIDVCINREPRENWIRFRFYKNCKIRSETSSYLYKSKKGDTKITVLKEAHYAEPFISQNKVLI